MSRFARVARLLPLSDRELSISKLAAYPAPSLYHVVTLEGYRDPLNELMYSSLITSTTTGSL